MNRLPQGCDEFYELNKIEAGCFALNARGDLALLAGYGDLQIMNLNRPRDRDAFLRGGSRNKWPVLCAKWSEHPARENSFITTKHNVADLWELDANGAAVVCKSSFKGHARQIADVDWCPQDNSLFATASLDSYTLIWDVRDARKPAIALRSAATVSHVRWNLSSSDLITTAQDTTLNLIDLRKQLAIHSVYAHESKISSVERCSFDVNAGGSGRLEAGDDAQTDNGEYVLTSGCDGLVKVWYATPYDSVLECVAAAEASGPVWRAKFAPFGFALLAALDESVDDYAGAGAGAGAGAADERNGERSTMQFWNAEELMSNQAGRTLFSHPDRVIDFHFRHANASSSYGASESRTARSGGPSWKLVTWCADRCVRVWKLAKSGVNALLHAVPPVSLTRADDQPRRSTVASPPTTALNSPSAASRNATISGDTQVPSAPRSRRALLSGDLPGCASGDDRVPAPPFCRISFAGHRLVCLAALERSSTTEQPPSQSPAQHQFARSLAQFEQLLSASTPLPPPPARAAHHAIVRQCLVPLTHVAICDARSLTASLGLERQLCPNVYTDYRMPNLLSLLFNAALGPVPVSSSGSASGSANGRAERPSAAQFADSLNVCRRELFAKCALLRQCALRNAELSELAARSDLEVVWSACAALLTEHSCPPDQDGQVASERCVAQPSVGRPVLLRVIERYLQVRDTQTVASVACFFTALDTLSRYEALLASVTEELAERQPERSATVTVEFDATLLELFWHFEEAHAVLRVRVPSCSLADRDSQVTPFIDSCTPINEATISQYVIVNTNEHRPPAPTPTATNGNALATPAAATNGRSHQLTAASKFERQCSVESAFPANAAPNVRKPQPTGGARKSPSPSVCSNDVCSASYTARSSLADTQTLTAERASEYDDMRPRSVSNLSASSNPQQAAKLLNRLHSASYVYPRFATLLDHLKLAYVRQLRSSGTHEQAEDIMKCLIYPLKFYSCGSAQSITISARKRSS